MAISIGEQIGDYEVIGSLGAGGIGEVYKVRHLISHRIEALKVLRPQQVGSTEPVERFMREIRVLASLNHPNIAALHTAFRQGEDLVMVMEFVPGDTLSSRLRSVGINIVQSVEYGKQILSALIYAHDQGVTHRDIKPSNVMVGGNDQVKLLDFGLAITGHDPSLTVAGWVLGSLHYMSPEQVNGRKADARSDLYSLGATMYELLTGKVPIEGATGYAIMAGHLHQQPTAPSTVNPDIPEELSRVIMKALAKNPEDRFQSAREFLQAFDTTSLEKTEALQLTQVFHIASAMESGGVPAVGESTPLSQSSSDTTVPLSRPQIPKPQSQPVTSSSSLPLSGRGTSISGTSVPSRQMPPGRAFPDKPVSDKSAPDRSALGRPAQGASMPGSDGAAPAGAQSQSTVPMPADPTPSGHNPAVLEKITRELAVYIGPIAKIVVQKASGRHRTVQDLYSAVAEEIESGKDREKFLATRRGIKK